MKKQTHIEELFDLINGGDDVDAAAEAQEIAEGLLRAAKKMLAVTSKEDSIPEALDKELAAEIAKAEGRTA